MVALAEVSSPEVENDCVVGLGDVFSETKVVVVNVAESFVARLWGVV